MNGPGTHSSGPRPKSQCGSPTMTSFPTLLGDAQFRCARPCRRAAGRVAVHAELLGVRVAGVRVAVVEGDLEVAVRQHGRIRALVEVAGVGRLRRAEGGGSFRASFGELKLGRCSGFRITAVGSRGDRAVLKLPQPACMPARSGS